MTTFTKRERRRGEYVANVLRAILGAGALITLAFALGGSSRAPTVEQRATELVSYAAAMRAAGFKGRGTLIWGSGHVAGQAFNMSGSSGFVEVQFGDDKVNPK